MTISTPDVRMSTDDLENLFSLESEKPSEVCTWHETANGQESTPCTQEAVYALRTLCGADFPLCLDHAEWWVVYLHGPDGSHVYVKCGGHYYRTDDHYRVENL